MDALSPRRRRVSNHDALGLVLLFAGIFAIVMALGTIWIDRAKH